MGLARLNAGRCRGMGFKRPLFSDCLDGLAVIARQDEAIGDAVAVRIMDEETMMMVKTE